MASLNEIQNKIKGKTVLYIDECGAGPLCGDLVVCGAILHSEPSLDGLTDSKKMTEKKREQLYPDLVELVDAYHIERISPEVIDDINIRNARLLGFYNTIQKISVRPDYVVIDGNMLPSDVSIPMDYLIKGDLLLAGLSVASVIGKVTRDREIIELASQEPYSKYGLEKHKGYGTKLHLEALNKYGPVHGFHRMSYAPVKKAYLNAGK